MGRLKKKKEDASLFDFIESPSEEDRDMSEYFSGKLERKIDPLLWILDAKHDRKKFKLFDDAGQIYELQLAKLEYNTFKNNLDLFRKRTAYFEVVDGEISYHTYLSEVKGKGQIGHTNQYLTHWFYPYKGKFHGQMIKAIINFMGAKNKDIVVDPFMGSGTTLIEATLVATNSVGIEINPALGIVAKVKLDSLRINYPEFKKNIGEGNLLSIFEYFNKAGEVLKSLQWTIEPNNQNIQEILNELWENHFPDGFIKDYPMEWRNILLLIYLHALSDYTYLKGTSKEKSFKEFFKINFKEYSKTLEETYKTLKKLDLKIGDPKVILGSALDLPLKDNSVKGIVTSPPYSIALDYVKNDLHLLNYLGINTGKLRSSMVGLKGKKNEKLRFYEEDMRKSVEEMYRVLKKGGWSAIVLGDVVVNSKRTDFCQKIIEWAPDIGFSDAYAMKRPILGGFARLRYEHILFLQK